MPVFDFRNLSGVLRTAFTLHENLTHINVSSSTPSEYAGYYFITFCGFKGEALCNQAQSIFLEFAVTPNTQKANLNKETIKICFSNSPAQKYNTEYSQIYSSEC
jgi:hypothetical protein